MRHRANLSFHHVFRLYLLVHLIDGTMTSRLLQTLQATHGRRDKKFSRFSNHLSLAANLSAVAASRPMDLHGPFPNLFGRLSLLFKLTKLSRPLAVSIQGILTSSCHQFYKSFLFFSPCAVLLPHELWYPAHTTCHHAVGDSSWQVLLVINIQGRRREE